MLELKLFHVVYASFCFFIFLLSPGKSKKLGLTGRPVEMAGILATSKIYSLGNQILAFFPQVNFADTLSIQLSIKSIKYLFNKINFVIYWDKLHLNISFLK